MIRHETPADIHSIRRVIELAFGRPNEARLVDALREAASPYLSLVAEVDGEVVGHICFSPVEVEREDGARNSILGLAPLAVLPERHNQGIGSRLVIRGLEECRSAGFDVVVVLGHPNYYPRFGFSPASRHGVRSEYDVPDPVFMIAELVPGAAAEVRGLARYHEVFKDVE